MPLSDKQFYAFLDHQLSLLGEQDPLEVLTSTPVRLSRLATERHSSQWRRRPEPETWSPLEILTHLRDMEFVFGFRLRTILHDDRPRLMGISQAAWNESWRETEESLLVVIEDFSALRAVNLRLWRNVTPEQLQRSGIHDEAGIEIPLSLLRRIQAGHDLSHLAQIEERL